MAGSRLGRLFGRDRTAPTEPAAIPDPRRPDPAPYGTAPYDSAEPPVVARGRLAETTRRRRAIDQQVGVLKKFEDRLSEQVRVATEAERHDYARELLSRRLSVRARLEEVTYRRGQLLSEEEQLSRQTARRPPS